MTHISRAGEGTNFIFFVKLDNYFQGGTVVSRTFNSYDNRVRFFFSYKSKSIFNSFNPNSYAIKSF